jgi:hypothetical protein
MQVLKSGSRWKSAVCDTQVMIIKGVGEGHELSCGGAPMIGANETGNLMLDPARAEGTLIGKRYVNADESLEVLCVKEGKGSLYLDGERLGPKQAKALPTSD